MTATATTEKDEGHESRDRRLAYQASEAARHIAMSHIVMGASPTFIALVAAHMAYQSLESIAMRDPAVAREMINGFALGLANLLEKFEEQGTDGEKK